MKSNVDLYLNEARDTVVLADDPAARSLLVNAGREIPDAEIEAMGQNVLEQALKLAKTPAPEPETPAEAPAEEEAPAEAESKEVPQTEVEDKGATRPRRTS